jgi:methionine synthase II (cobalamin-independent)
MTRKLQEIAGLLSTTQVGQYPRPAWYKYEIRDNDFLLLTATDPEFKEAYADACNAIITDHESAGLDIITDGALRFDRRRRIASWGSNGLAYMDGAKLIPYKPDERPIAESIITPELYKASLQICNADYPPVGGFRWAVEDRLEPGKLRNWVETFKIARTLASKPLKFSGPSAANAAEFAVNRSSRSDRDVYFDFFRVQNQILRELADAGCEIIQLDFPFGAASWAATKARVKEELWQELIEAANLEIEGVNAQIWYHFCFGAPLLWGHQAPPLRYHVADTYKQMGESKAHVLQSEAANTKGEYLDVELTAWKEHCAEKEIAIGAVTPYNGLETTEDVDRVIEKALKYVPAEHLALTSDEGLGGHETCTREVAFEKMKLLVASAVKARKRL